MKYLAKKLTLVILLILVVASNAFAQPTPNPFEPEKKQFKRPKFFNKLYLGGNIGSQFESALVIELTPQMLYRPNRYLQVGLGGSYIFSWFIINKQEYINNIYAGRAFLRLLPVHNLLTANDAVFFHSEYELMNLEDYSNPSIVRGRFNMYALNLGGGYLQTDRKSVV